MKLNSIDPEDIEDWLIRVEKSFEIQFGDRELAHIRTFGELCDHIVSKIPLSHSGGCTTQQAFYKLRKAITIISDMDSVVPETELTKVLPRHQRRQKTRQLEESLALKLSILEPPNFIVIPLGIALLSSPLCFFLSWQLGLLVLGCSILGLWTATKLGKELSVRTVGELAQKMARENYLKSRRQSATVNENEIESLLIGWFSEAFLLNDAKLTRDAKFA